MTLDITDTLAAKSDQLNADDLISGPITVQVVAVKRASSGDQPIDVHITGHKPWRPCKTMRRLLALAWGTDAAKWSGRWLVLWRDPTALWAGKKVGGIRIKAMSHIDKGGVTGTFNATEKKKAEVSASYFEPPAESKAPTLDSLGLTLDQINAWKATTEKPDPVTESTLGQMLGWLAKDPARVAAVLAVREPGQDG